jgi:hypothetical protein
VIQISSLPFPIARHQLGSANEIRLQVDRILSHRLFSRSPRLSQLFRFAIEKSLAGETHLLKEYTIGVDVFGRSEDFDGRLDSIVRVEASRLRKKLSIYYETAGKADRLMITMQQGGYIPCLTTRESMPMASQPAPLIGMLDCRNNINHHGRGAQCTLGEGIVSLNFASLATIGEVFAFIVVCVDQFMDPAEQCRIVETALSKASGVAIISNLECLDILPAVIGTARSNRKGALSERQTLAGVGNSGLSA